ncbi:unnamed protein product (macronuclear) [Paramecium tetraurelia]|uniref:Transmembrane protein n=1 Tax=Paramecium tetraurelia TaxID=5888 RepID=A0CY89_PARTE|nr:uncharacterized protein GSPATT00039094001 [Paramecium tetraurelia]CAK75756.1 unnamed protein product [Paramecium tetraurelia]|eukprot:XP_001443153.1 hypothetical protein (macronuclear) [Paramecium tetraurelia strain d4-2]
MSCLQRGYVFIFINKFCSFRRSNIFCPIIQYFSVINVYMLQLFQKVSYFFLYQMQPILFHQIQYLRQILIIQSKGCLLKHNFGVVLHNLIYEQLSSASLHFSCFYDIFYLDLQLCGHSIHCSKIDMFIDWMIQLNYSTNV